MTQSTRPSPERTYGTFFEHNDKLGSLFLPLFEKRVKHKNYDNEDVEKL